MPMLSTRGAEDLIVSPQQAFQPHAACTVMAGTAAVLERPWNERQTRLKGGQP